MSLPVRSLRLLPKPKSELDRLSGNKGEIFYDSTSQSLRIFDGAILGGTLQKRRRQLLIKAVSGSIRQTVVFTSTTKTLTVISG